MRYSKYLLLALIIFTQLNAALVSEQDINDAMSAEIKHQLPRYQDLLVVPHVQLRETQKKILNLELKEPHIKVKLRSRTEIFNMLFSPVAIYDGATCLQELICKFNIQIFAEVYHARHALEKGSPVSADQLYLKKVDILNYAEKMADKDFELSGKVLTARVNADEPVAAWKIRQLPLVTFGDIITVSFSSGGIEIKMPVKVLQQGYLGDNVRVITLETKKTFKAEILAKNQGRVRL